MGGSTVMMLLDKFLRSKNKEEFVVCFVCYSYVIIIFANERIVQKSIII